MAKNTNPDNINGTMDLAIALQRGQLAGLERDIRSKLLSFQRTLASALEDLEKQRVPMTGVLQGNSIDLDRMCALFNAKQREIQMLETLAHAVKTAALLGEE